MKTLLLLGRPACALCEDWEDSLHQAFAGRFHLDWRDVDRRADWRAQYGQRIPVLLDEAEQPLAVGQLDLQAVERYLAAG